MDEETFWELVGSIGRNPAAGAYGRLTDALSDHGADDIRDFADHLARATIVTARSGSCGRCPPGTAEGPRRTGRAGTGD